jgi:hypothetical protein
MLQSDGKKVSVRIQIDSNTAIGAVTYPDLSCSGTLTLAHSTDTTFSLREQITSGSCTPTGTVTLTITSAGLSFQYQPDNNRYTASGYLRRL